MSEFKLNRRRFVAGSAIAAGGLVLGVYPTARAAATADDASAQGLRPNAWLRITPDDRVIFQLDKTEMGQGVSTSLPTIIAEELEIDPRRIVVQAALVDKTFQDPIQITGGSASVNARWDVLRKTGAQAREMLVAAAAIRWGVKPDQCRAENGRVVRVGTDQSFS
ncbi:MAG TPA: molybdopterin cofactor-binding domain-containing protein, partial [Pseudomonadales bacterium]|nr:molybdopterin cofactor-binding domain-containing protein [Pseudomonadales bacterium]